MTTDFTGYQPKLGHFGCEKVLAFRYEKSET